MTTGTNFLAEYSCEVAPTGEKFEDTVTGLYPSEGKHIGWLASCVSRYIGGRSSCVAD
jgi:hypothetical protein